MYKSLEHDRTIILLYFLKSKGIVIVSCDEIEGFVHSNSAVPLKGNTVSAPPGVLYPVILPDVS